MANKTKFYAASDAMINFSRGVFANNATIFSMVLDDLTPDYTDIFLRTSHDGSVRVEITDDNAQVTSTIYHEIYNIINIPIPANTINIDIYSNTDPSIGISHTWLLREQHEFEVQPSMKGSSTSRDDRLSKSQTGRGHNAWSPLRSNLKFNFNNHPSSADSEYIRELALSREKVYCWPCGGYFKGRDENELPEWLAYDNLILIACNRHKFEPYDDCWSLGITGSASFYEPIDDLTSFTIPTGGRLLCFLDGTPWCTLEGDQVQTV